ncbi:MAG: hypothetical protein LC104_10885 [Bacteroidales bacterium]|nr:hypothetical protein [Bacteroidales bacterium]
MSIERSPISIMLKTNNNLSAIDEEFATVTLKNVSSEAISLSSQLNFGVLSMLDIDVRNADGQRISQSFYFESISSPFAESKPVIQLNPCQTVSFSLSLLSGVSSDALTDGAYTCVVIFKADAILSKSNEIKFAINKHKVANGK